MPTQTFSMWFGDFVADFYRGKFAGQRLGQAFVDQLTIVRPFVAGGFIYAKCDPYYLDEVPTEALDFVARNW